MLPRGSGLIAVGKGIPISMEGAPSIEVDGALVAGGLGLAVDVFRQLMQAGRINVLCERGTGEDLGLYRASFYHEGRRVRLVVDLEGKIIDRIDS